MNEQTLKHYWGIFIIIFILTGAIGVGVVMSKLNNPSAPAPVAEIPTQSDPDAQFPSFTLDQVAKHANASSCYMAAYGNVYDVTEYVTERSHPGGQNSLLGGCGKEVTSLFDRIHSSGAKADLEEFKIGVLADA